MKISIVILLTLIYLDSYGQFDFESNSPFEVLYPNYVSKIEKLNQDFDFQFRLWIHGPENKKNELFILTTKSGLWSCDHYSIRYYERRKNKIIDNKLDIENCDLLWKFLADNDILLLNGKVNQTNIGNRDADSIIIAGGLTYSFEFIRDSKYRRIEYHCPITLSKNYSNSIELEQVTKIIWMIHEKLRLKFDPC